MDPDDLPVYRRRVAPRGPGPIRPVSRITPPISRLRALSVYLGFGLLLAVVVTIIRIQP